MEITRLTDKTKGEFAELFTAYYNELDCDDDCDELIGEYVLPDFEAGLLDIYLAVDGGAKGFIIFQRDDIDNDWNFKEGWGDIRELYIAPDFRNQGLGTALLSFACGKLGKKVYLLPTESSEKFFTARGFEDCGEYNPDLDNKVFMLK